MRILFLLLLLPLASLGQQRTSLDNNWEFLKSDLGSAWEAVRPVAKGSSEAVPHWSKVDLPHCYNAFDAVNPNVNYYQGPAWYRKNISLDSVAKTGRTLLHFEGVGQKAQVYVFTEKVGEHIGGYDAWTVDLTDAIARFRQSEESKRFKGKIPISIRVDNSRDVELLPSDLSDFNIYGGIYRHVYLEQVPNSYLKQVYSNAVLEENSKKSILNLSADIRTSNEGETVVVQAKLYNPQGRLIKQVEKLSRASERLEFEPIVLSKVDAWSPENPHLYKVEVNLKQGDLLQTVTQNIGFRNFKFVEHGPFLLNGKRLLLRGTHRHEDHAGLGAAMPDSLIRKEMVVMKEMGVNFIRLGHYQQSPYVLDLCDSLGILVWEEIPWCRGGLGGEVYRRQAKRMLTNMIQQHNNHPSIIIWGLGNENDWRGDFPAFEQDSIRRFMSELNDLAHRLDASRKTAIRRCDFCKDIVDVYSPSIWAGWYRGSYTEYKAESEKAIKDVRHFLHAEWGGDSHAGRHSENPDKALMQVQTGKGADERDGDASLYGGAARISKDGDWSESYICNLIDWHLKEQETMLWLTGSAYWPFKDFSTPVRPENPVPYMNQKGVVERDLTKKEAYYVFQSYWTEKPMVHIYGHTWPMRWGAAGEQKMIKVYSNCDEAELFLNGTSLGKKKRNSQDFPAAGLRWESSLRPGENHIRVVARKGKIVVTDEITTLYQEGQWGNPASLTLREVSDENGVVTLEALLLDKDGKRCLEAKNIIRFSAIGGGELLVDLGTSSGSSQVEMYNGRALIRLHKAKGKTIVRADVDRVC
nr:glycoside hydrolase family 2 TIM barrel-domain containing protein [Olivibacter sitiensis]